MRMHGIMKRYWLIIALSAAVCMFAAAVALGGWESLAVAALNDWRARAEPDSKGEGEGPEDRQQPVVALTFDDGPIPGCTDVLLEGPRFQVCEAIE